MCDEILIQDPFEMPRQQIKETDIMQLKAAEKLADTILPPPAPSLPVTEEEFYSSLSNVQKLFFDEYKQKIVATEKELFEVKQQLDGEKRWNSELLDDCIPLNILNEKHDAEQQSKESELRKRVNATTHSYTAQVVINAEGELMLPMLVIFCEPNKPQCFETQLAPFKNIQAVSTKSGMMTSELGIYWLENIFKPSAGENSVLIVDSWNGYIKAFAQDNDKTEHYILPPKSTGVAQPLDVYFMRIFKNFIRTLTYKARRETTFTVSDRKGMATILDITVGQFAAPIFRPMLQYSWYAAGYLDERPDKFETPVTVCFDCIEIDDQCSVCEKWPFMKCAHCMQYFCFNHFVKNIHRCYN